MCRYLATFFVLLKLNKNLHKKYMSIFSPYEKEVKALYLFFCCIEMTHLITLANVNTQHDRNTSSPPSQAETGKWSKTQVPRICHVRCESSPIPLFHHFLNPSSASSLSSSSLVVFPFDLAMFKMKCYSLVCNWNRIQMLLHCQYT